MQQKDWAFLSNHGHVFEYIAKHPQSTIQDMAFKTNLSIGGVQNIVEDLEASGYIAKFKIGRRNQYIVHAELPMRHCLDRDFSVGDVLKAIGCKVTN
jgi:predicted transcriptional regulator